MGYFSVVLLGAALLAGVPASADQSPLSNFERWFAAARARGLTIPAVTLERVKNYRFAFVGGYRNERMPGYFSQNMGELRALGIERSRIDLIHPSSSKVWEENAEAVRAGFEAIAAKGPEKLVVIAHSRGACDALAFALANPGFVRDRVEAIYLIQGPFGGSGVAEYVLGRGMPTDRRMWRGQRLVASVMGRLARIAASRSGLGALEGMTREVSKAFWEKVLRRDAEALATIGPRVYFIRSQIHPSRQRIFRRVIAWYQKIYLGPGDGMVELVDQALPGVGTILGTLEAGHADLTHRFPASGAPPQFRRALTRSLLMALGERTLPPSDARADLGQDAVPEVQPSLQRDSGGESGVAPPRPVATADRIEHP